MTWVKKSDSTPGFEAVKSNYKSSGDIASSASVQLTDVAYDTAIKVVVYAEDSKGLEAVAPLVLTLKAKASTPTEAPVTTTPTPTTRATINPSVSESKVTGLEKALAFYPPELTIQTRLKVIPSGSRMAGACPRRTLTPDIRRAGLSEM